MKFVPYDEVGDILKNFDKFQVTRSSIKLFKTYLNGSLLPTGSTGSDTVGTG